MTIDTDKIKVDLFYGPAGGYGFRKGTWTAEYDGQTYKFFASIPHGAELDAQERMLKEVAARHIAAQRK
jgi:hypothetical protein